MPHAYDRKGKNMAYSWNPVEPLMLVGEKVQANKREIYVTCPFCGSKRFAYNTIKGIGQCWSCEKTADSAKYYATAMNMSLYEARKDIEERLGIIDSSSIDKASIPPRIVYSTKATNEATKAKSEVLDRTYRAFLSELTLSEKNRAMLRARGMSDAEMTAREYKTFPSMSEINYFNLCKKLLADGCILEGVPGFYMYKGAWTFVQLTKGIIMPQKNYQDQIVGLQIRKDDDLRSYIEELGDYEAKCAWFSSKNREHGCGANADVHYACDFKYDSNSKLWRPVCKDGFVLTEGIMKADIVHHLQNNLPVIAVPGVHALENLKKELERIKGMGVETILLCYDMDYKTNPNVQKALEKTKALIEEKGLRCKSMMWETKIIVNGKEQDLLKGLDDYLAYTSLGIVPQIKHK